MIRWKPLQTILALMSLVWEGNDETYAEEKTRFIVNKKIMTLHYITKMFYYYLLLFKIRTEFEYDFLCTFLDALTSNSRKNF